MAVERLLHINFIQLKLNYVITHAVYISDLCFTLTCYTPLAICQASKSSTAGLFPDNAQAAWHVRNQYSGYWRPPSCGAEQWERPTSITYPSYMINPDMCVLSSSCLTAFDKLPRRTITVHWGSKLQHVSPFTSKSVCSVKSTVCHHHQRQTITV